MAMDHKIIKAVASLDGVLGTASKHRDLPVIIGVIGILFLILIPLPAPVMDMFLIMNITLSLLILLTTIYVKSPLDFSAFPSLLLMVTLYRLALNIATTRLIETRRSGLTSTFAVLWIRSSATALVPTSN